MTEIAVEKTTSRRWTFILVTAAVAFYWSSLYFYVPSLGLYAQDKINDLAQVGVVLSMYGLWQAILRLPVGIAADWLGRRKPFILGGYVLCALGAWMMATASGYDGLVWGRAMTGLAAAAWVPLTVLFSSLFPPEEAVRATGLLALVNAISRMAATGLNGPLNTLGGYGLAFYVAIGVAGLAALVTLPIREPARPPKAPALRTTGALIIRRDVLLPALLSAVSQYIVWCTTFGFLPMVAKNLGASNELQGLLVTLNLGISMGGNFLTAALARRIGSRNLLYLSFGGQIIGLVLLASASGLWMVIAAQALIGLGYGISFPLCMGMSIEHVVDSDRATAMGLHQSVYAIGMFAGPWLSGILAERMGLPWMFGATAAGGLVLSIGLVAFLRKE